MGMIESRIERIARRHGIRPQGIEFRGGDHLNAYVHGSSPVDHEIPKTTSHEIYGVPVTVIYRPTQQ